MSGAIRHADITAADIGAARARFPRAFSSPWPQRAIRAALAVAFVAWLGYLHWLFDFARIFSGLDRLWVILGLMVDWSRFASWDHVEIWKSMLETIAMAFLGTLLASIVALPLGFLGARNVIPSGVFRFMTRRVFDVFRGLDQLIWALVFVRAMGLGPIAGILAIFVSDTGVLAKLYSEAVENADRGQADGIRAAGAAQLMTLRFGVLPQVLPVMLSQARGDDLGTGRCGRHRTAAVGAHPDQCMGPGGVYHRADPDHGGGDRFCVEGDSHAADPGGSGITFWSAGMRLRSPVAGPSGRGDLRPARGSDTARVR